MDFVIGWSALSVLEEIREMPWRGMIRPIVAQHLLPNGEWLHSHRKLHAGEAPLVLMGDTGYCGPEGQVLKRYF